MSIKYTKHFLQKLEDIMYETDYILRYEKGNFQSGYCLLQDRKIAIVNKYFALDGKINSLMDIIRSITIDLKNLSESNRKLYLEISQNRLGL